MPLLNVVLVPAPDQVVVRLTGDADLSTVPLLSDALAQAAGLGTPHLVVDVAAARFWDSSALRTLAEVGAELAGDGRGCRIVGAGAATRRLIRAAGLADVLTLDGPVYQRVAPEPDRPARRPASLRTRPSLRPARTPVGAIPLHRWS
ncbi:STAS domain-containing protein [Geodermatophilus sp. URMC 64]